MNEDNADIDLLLDELKRTNTNPTSASAIPAFPTVTEAINPENMEDFIIRKAAHVIQQSIDVSEMIKDGIISTGDAESIEAYSKILTSSSNAIDVLNKINLQNKRIKSAKELETMKIDAKKSIGAKQVNTNILIATREEIMKQLVDGFKGNEDNAPQEITIKESDLEETGEEPPGDLE